MIDNSIIIALTGLAGAGKDTVADTLVTHAGFSKIAFADALRLEVAQAFCLWDRYGILSDRDGKEQPHPLLTMARCDNPEFVNCVAKIEEAWLNAEFLQRAYSPRRILQWWGTEFRRAQQANYWSTKVALQVARMHDADQVRVVITDCRFSNEANAVRIMGGEIWQVVRPGQPVVEHGHASQTMGNKLRPDATLVNGADINGLCHSVLRLLITRHGGAVITVY